MLSVSYKFKYMVDLSNEVNFIQDGYVLVDYCVILILVDSNWYVVFIVNNLLDEDYEVYLVKILLIVGVYVNGVY